VGLLNACSAPAYSPGLGLGVDNVPKKHKRLALSLERVPHALSAREGWSRMSTSVGFRYEGALSDNVSVRTKLFFSLSKSRSIPGNDGLGTGLSFTGIFRNRLGTTTDLLLVPRLQVATGSLVFGGMGTGLGGAILMRRRFSPEWAIYGGPAAYFGDAPGTIITRDGGSPFKPGGRALGGHFGLSHNVGSGGNLNVEITPLNQRDNYHQRAVWVPSVQLAYTHQLKSRTRTERRERRELRRKKKHEATMKRLRIRTAKQTGNIKYR